MKAKSKTELLQAKVDPKLVEAVDVLCERQFRTRSDIIRQGLLKELEANGLARFGSTRPKHFARFCAIVREEVNV